MKEVDLLKLRWFEVVEKHIVDQQGQDNYLILEYERGGGKDFIVMGKIDLQGLKSKKQNVNDLVPIINEVIIGNRKNILRQEKKPNYGYEKFKTHEVIENIKFTTEFYDFITAKFEYTNKMISTTVDFQKKEDKYFLLPEQKRQLLNQKFYKLEDLEKKYSLSEKDIENMREIDLKRYIRDNNKKLNTIFEAEGPQLLFETERTDLDERYQNEYQNLLRKSDVEQLAYRYFNEKYSHIFLTIDDVVKLGDKELTKYITQKKKELLATVPLTVEEKAEIICSKDHRIEDHLFKAIARQSENKWLNTRQLAIMDLTAVNQYISQNRNKILAIVEKDEHYSDLHPIILANNEKQQNLLMFFIDLKIAKKIISENVDDLEEQRIRKK